MDKSNETLKLKTKKCYSRIKSSLDPKGHVVDKLFEKGVITPTQHKEMNGGPDKETRADNVLTHLLQTSHPQAFVVFRKALKKDYQWIVKMIDETEVSTNEVTSSGEFQTTGSAGLVSSDGNRMPAEKTGGGSKRNLIPKFQCIVLGVVQLVAGVIALIASRMSNDQLDMSGYAGIITILSGIVAVLSGVTKDISIVMGQAFLSIMSSIGSLIFMVLGIVDLNNKGSVSAVPSDMLVAAGIIGLLSSMWTAGIGCHFACCECCFPWFSRKYKNNDAHQQI